MELQYTQEKLNLHCFVLAAKSESEALLCVRKLSLYT